MPGDILKYYSSDITHLDNTYSTPLDIKPNAIIKYCNIRCKLDISNLNKKTTPKDVDVNINPLGIPHICIDMETHKYHIEYNGVVYNLIKIIILNDYLHKTVLKSRRGESGKSGFETLLYFEGQLAEPKKLCISLNTIKMSSGSEFFVQILRPLQNRLLGGAHSVQGVNWNDGTNVEIVAPVDSSWQPQMIIPKTQTYYKYTGVWPFKPESQLQNKRCTWILYLDQIEISTDNFEIIQTLLPIRKTPITSNSLPLIDDVNTDTIIIYKHIDTKKNKLNEDDLVIKCEKENDEYDCDAGDIEYQKAQGELYDASSTCPMTISSKEINTLYKSYLTDFVPSAANLIIKIINVIIYTTALILGYMLAKFSMEHFNGNILFQLGNLGWHACKSVSGAVKSETGKKLGRGIVNVVKHPVKTLHPANIKKGFGAKVAKGGVMLTPQDKFINQYEINQLRH